MVAALQYQSYTAEEFLGMDLPEGQEFELIDGIITPRSEPSGKHESLRSELMAELIFENRRGKLGMEIHPKPVLKLGPRDTCRPDLIAINRESWKAQTIVEAVLEQPPEVAIEIVDGDWVSDYITKPAWYANIGVQELWIVDPLFTIEHSPVRRNLKIRQPTILIGQPEPASSPILGLEYKFSQYVGSDRIQSKFFPGLALTVEQIIALGSGL